MNTDQILHLSKLCKIKITDDEARALEKDLKSILAYVEQLNEVNTDGVEPCYQVVTFDHNVFAEDEVGSTIPIKDYLENVPSYVGNLIRTPPVIKF